MTYKPWRWWMAALLLVSTAAMAESAPRVKVTTSMGDFVIELAPERAPLTAANFLRYVREGYYSNTLIHRVVGNFVVQGGGYSATDMKLKPVHEPVVNESGNGLQNKRGTVGIARSEAPHSGNAQFYVNINDNSDLDPVATRWGYAVFGHVVEGMEVIERIGVVPTGSVAPFKGDAPLKPVIIEKVELLSTASAGAPATVSPPVVPAAPATATPPAPTPASPTAPASATPPAQ